MEHSAIIQSRNMFIILFFSVSVIGHFIIGHFFDDTNELITTLFGFFLISALLIMHRLGINPLVLRNYIVIGYSGFVFLINVLMPETSHLLYLLFPIILTTAYTSIWLTIVLTAITCMEAILLFHFFKPYYLLDSQTGLLIHFAFFFIMVAILCFLHSLKIGPIWRMIYSENKRMDTILSTKEGYLDLFFEHTEDAIVVLSTDLKILTVNPAFENMYGWHKTEIIDKYTDLVPPSERCIVEERTKNILNGASYHHIKTKEMRKDGSVFDAELTVSPIYNDNQQIVAISCIARDITLKSQAEKLRIDTEKVKAIGEIAASVAHEIRNPVTTISGFVQMMNNDPANPYHAYTKIMESEVNQIDLIVGEFLVLSKPYVRESNEFIIQDTLQHVLAMLNIEFTERSILYTIDMAEQKAFVRGNEAELKQVFINIFKNACEALVKDGCISITVTLQTETVSISIVDNGPGMDQETLEQMYEPFFTTKYDGTGLGLMIARKIITDHGGSLTVASDKHEGTETIITLPLI